MESNDSRFPNAIDDIWQHRINNPNDWEDNWIFNDSRFNLMSCDDSIFLNFLCEMIHPIVRENSSFNVGSPPVIVARTLFASTSARLLR